MLAEYIIFLQNALLHYTSSSLEPIVLSLLL